jgi:hypothetical protein
MKTMRYKNLYKATSPKSVIVVIAPTRKEARETLEKLIFLQG